MIYIVKEQYEDPPIFATTNKKKAQKYIDDYVKEETEKIEEKYKITDDMYNIIIDKRLRNCVTTSLPGCREDTYKEYYNNIMSQAEYYKDCKKYALECLKYKVYIVECEER